MEDFIERVGQSYLERKAFAVPQQLENLAKKQLTGGGEERAKAKDSTENKATKEEEEREERKRQVPKKKRSVGKSTGHSSSGSSEKDEEIARLNKQLAQLKLETPKPSSGKNALGLKKSGVSRAANGQKAFIKKTAKGEKETKGLAALEAVKAEGGRHARKKSKSGEKEASGSGLAEANMIEISPTKRRTSKSQHSEHSGGGRSEHGGGSMSEHGGRSMSEHGEHAKSTVSHPAAASEGKRRPSSAPQSEHGSRAMSVAPAPMYEHLPAHAERFEEERGVMEWRWPRSQHEDERDLYTVEVEEEDAGGVVEVETSEGKTVYRI